MLQDRLDKLREKLGITSGYGMVPGDKGYDAGVNVSQQQEKEISEEIEATE